MAPDLNSLPPSRSPEHPPLQTRVFSNTTDPHRRQTPSPRSSSISLAAAATINAGIQQQQQDSRRSSTSNRPSPQLGRTERRRSNVAMSLNFNDPTLPGPGELAATDHRSSIGHSFRTTSPHSIGGSPTVATGDPHHQRAPSLGELHQELEQEQEAQVVSPPCPPCVDRTTSTLPPTKIRAKPTTEPPPPHDSPTTSSAPRHAVLPIPPLHLDHHSRNRRLHNPHLRTLLLIPIQHRTFNLRLPYLPTSPFHHPPNFHHQPPSPFPNSPLLHRPLPAVIPSLTYIQQGQLAESETAERDSASPWR